MSFFLLMTSMTDVWGQDYVFSKRESVQEANKKMEVARREQTLHPTEYLQSVLNLADAYYYNQDYPQARMYYWEYIRKALRRGKFDFYDPAHLEVLKQICMSSFYLGDYEESVEQFREYLEIANKIGNLYKEELICYCWMVENYIRSKKYDYAKMGIDKINGLIEEYKIEDRYIKFLSKFVEADFVAQTDPLGDIDLVQLLSNLPLDIADVEGVQLLASFYCLLGTHAMRLADFKLAAKCFKEGIKEMERGNLTKGIDYFNANFNLMLVQALSVGQGDNLIPYSSKLNAIALKGIQESFPKMTEKQRAAYWSRFNEWFTFYLPRLAVKGENPKLLRETYIGILIAKGLLLRSAVSLQSYILHYGSEEQIEILEQIQYLNKKLQYWQESGDESAAQEIFNIQTNENRLQQRILQSVGSIDFMSDVLVNVDSVRSCLGKNDVAIEFLGLERDVQGRDSSKTRVKEYYAFVLKSDYKYPHVKRLCTSLSLPKSNDDTYLLYRLIWQPLKDELKGVKRVFFSLDGEMHRFPVEYSQSEGGHLMIDRYDMYRLSSTRELLTDRHHIINNNKVYIFGNIDYNESLGPLSKATPVEAFETSCTIGGLYAGSEKRGADAGALIYYNDLRYSKHESYRVASLCLQRDLEPWVYERGNATEEVFKSISGRSPSIMSLSTHGYYLSAEEWNASFSKDKPNFTEISFEEESLSHSGLVLAGANNFLLNKDFPPNHEDGFVTAREIARMNLDNTDLVVLSACETGLGAVSSEGVIGLQRGFKRAGVQSLIMSLWEVNDYATAIFVEHFYENYFMSNSKQKAMKEAIHYLRSVDDGLWDSPKYWGAFILLDGNK